MVIQKLERIWNEYQERKQKRIMIYQIEDMMKKSFHTAQLFLEMKSEFGKNYVYPTVLKIEIFETHVEIFGRIPKGMNPQLFHQKEYIFQQYLQENIQIITNVSNFTIRVFPERMKAVKYEYESFPIQKFKMPVVVGKNRFNEWITFSMIENPTVLIAGIPGSGKSVMCRQLLTTFMQHHTAQELEIHLLDLKGSEFHIFEKCEHVQSMSVRASEFHPIMKKLKKEIDKRGRVLREHGAAHIDKLPHKYKLPYIVLMIDEILLLNDGTSESKETQRLLLEWAALGRALGCFTIISLQRPCNKSLDTRLRGILNARIVFKTEDKTNSEIAGVVGAENITRDEPGRMIFKIDKNDMQDVQAPFLDIKPAQSIVKKFKRRVQHDDYKPRKVVEEKKLFGLLN